MKNLLFLLSCFFLLSCGTDNPIENTIQKEVEMLTDKKSQRAFLEEIGAADQTVRNAETAANQQYGYDSKEHKQAIQTMIDTDKNNLEKIEAYIIKHGYPNKIDHGNKGFYAPWIVMHHAPKASGTRRRNFKYLYEYYKKDMLEPDRLTFFLARMYDMEFGERIQWNGPFTVQQELDSMINALGLREITDEIDTRFQSN